MDDQNPAVAAQTRIPPAMLEAVAKDPRQLTELSRKLLLVRIDKIHRLLNKPEAPASAQMQFAEFLAKVGDVIPKASAGGNAGPGFYVNFIVKKPEELPKVEVVEAPAKVEQLTTNADG